MSIKTPKWEKEIDSNERQEQIYDYCQLRNYTKDLLENPKDEASKEKLSKLIIKLNLNN